MFLNIFIFFLTRNFILWILFFILFMIHGFLPTSKQLKGWKIPLLIFLLFLALVRGASLFGDHLIRSYGEPAQAQLIDLQETFIRKGDRTTYRYYFEFETLEGKIVNVSLTRNFNIHPLPTVGEIFPIKYMEGSPKLFLILDNF